MRSQLVIQEDCGRGWGHACINEDGIKDRETSAAWEVQGSRVIVEHTVVPGESPWWWRSKKWVLSLSAPGEPMQRWSALGTAHRCPRYWKLGRPPWELDLRQRHGHRYSSLTPPISVPRFPGISFLNFLSPTFACVIMQCALLFDRRTTWLGAPGWPLPWLGKHWTNRRKEDTWSQSFVCNQNFFPVSNLQLKTQ